MDHARGPRQHLVEEAVERRVGVTGRLGRGVAQRGPQRRRLPDHHGWL
jgi:hypothetical protein